MPLHFVNDLYFEIKYKIFILQSEAILFEIALVQGFVELIMGEQFLYIFYWIILFVLFLHCFILALYDLFLNLIGDIVDRGCVLSSLIEQIRTIQHFLVIILQCLFECIRVILFVLHYGSRTYWRLT